MSQIIVSSERVYNARPEDIYEVLTDYKTKRPLILPPNYEDYKVVEGGKGEGTVVDYRFHAAQRERSYHISVNEVVKGKVLQEKDANSSFVTTWTLTPEGEGAQTRVSVASEWQGGEGVGGFFERTFAPLGLRRVYGQMLDMLGYVVQKDGTTCAVPPRKNMYTGVAIAAVAAIAVIALLRKRSK
ncbi:uncharacterized protein YndB with AHSA1/START domain [Thermosporothrix hazakensis]|jgi:uncharacterized protein YndB with AHSA1/START domain|uniref:Uncharacterized protein YndB with AHSA1/START domain n=2 Tax=Thermosporothrix TaxID=768650 RepID=A0A326U3Q5_THEHA|nr:SRPBCC family protein [Thermosporothrix hazakensis]PZW25387.1 uncharacterized protein YndB with AHSA1/START domain [Thermosporothrix hazakensis]BBH90721.1 polyketide cyclase [Thermosporothrix sp. COM3]GCE48771.1 polyketide cyclase [Thermosporothrix hazakensis]